MPELPDLVYVRHALARDLAGKRVAKARVGDPTVMRMLIAAPFESVLAGATLQAVERRGHFLRFVFDGDREVIVNAMLVGKYRVLLPNESHAEKDPVALGFALTFDDGRELRYLDDKRMGKVYVLKAKDQARVPVFANLGIDVLSPSFDVKAFSDLARGRRDQVRVFLMDKSALASIGNAYADEILFAARIHPKTMVRQLSPEALHTLFESIQTVLRQAIAVIEERGAPTDVKVRDFLAVRGRDGEPCPRCSTKIRSVRVRDGDACFCPQCQPATRRLFVDWGKLSAAKPEATTHSSAPKAIAPPKPVASDKARSPRPSRRSRNPPPGTSES